MSQPDPHDQPSPATFPPPAYVTGTYAPATYQAPAYQAPTYPSPSAPAVYPYAGYPPPVGPPGYHVGPPAPPPKRRRRVWPIVVAVATGLLLLLRLVGLVASGIERFVAEDEQPVSPEQQTARLQIRTSIDAAALRLQSTDEATAAGRAALQAALDQAVDAYAEADLDSMQAAVRAVDAAAATVPEPAVPDVVAVPVPADAVTVRDLATARPGDTRGDYATYLAAVHADDVYVSTDYEAYCGPPEGDARWLQACVPRVGVYDPHVIVVKPVADGAVPGVYGKFLALHAYGHVLQARVGIGDVEAASDALFGAGDGVERSADCIAFELGAVRSHDTEMTDCSGARGELARSILAGHL